MLFRTPDCLSAFWGRGLGTRLDSEKLDAGLGTRLHIYLTAENCINYNNIMLLVLRGVISVKKTECLYVGLMTSVSYFIRLVSHMRLVIYKVHRKQHKTIHRT